MKLTISKLRENIYQLFDQILESGEPLELERKGRRFVISCEPEHSKFAQVTRRDICIGDSEDIIHLDWSKEWNHDLP